MSEWVILAGFVGIGMIPMVGAVCAISWAIQDWLRSRHH